MQINRCCIHILTRCQGEKGSLSFRERRKHRQGEARGQEEGGELEGGREAYGMGCGCALCRALPAGRAAAGHQAVGLSP